MNLFGQKLRSALFVAINVAALGFTAAGCKDQDTVLTSPSLKDDPITTIIPASSILKYTAFKAGENTINAFRIPSLVTAKDGSLLAFAESRKSSWRDKSPTDVVVKRSTDNGATWSAFKIIANGGNSAYMDPTAVVDEVTGKIFLFMCYWPSVDHSTLSNTAWLATSDDNGETWSALQNVTSKIVPTGHYVSGFGPGSGFQMTSSTKFKDRLIMPFRVYNGDVNRNRTLYSDDHGVTWKVGQATSDGGEFQIAHSPNDVLMNNRRGDGIRYQAKSTDGGITWTRFAESVQLRTVAGGCQGSVYGVGNILFYTGPAGGAVTATTDNRSNLMIYRSKDGGDTYTKQFLLFNKAAGYSCITRMKDGRFAVIFETAATQGFIRTATRGAEWMNLDVIILPKEILQSDHWFTK